MLVNDVRTKEGRSCACFCLLEWDVVRGISRCLYTLCAKQSVHGKEWLKERNGVSFSNP